jgi:hypothetical protein
MLTGNTLTGQRSADSSVSLINKVRRGGRSMRAILTVCGVALVTGCAIMPLVGRGLAADDKPVQPLSAKELGKEWRYPGTGIDKDSKGDKFIWEFSGPIGAELKNLDRTTMQFGQPKASFEDVWNCYAGKCGYDKK